MFPIGQSWTFCGFEKQATLCRSGYEFLICRSGYTMYTPDSLNKKKSKANKSRSISGLEKTIPHPWCWILSFTPKWSIDPITMYLPRSSPSLWNLEKVALTILTVGRKKRGALIWQGVPRRLKRCRRGCEPIFLWRCHLKGWELHDVVKGM